MAGHETGRTPDRVGGLRARMTAPGQAVSCEAHTLSAQVDRVICESVSSPRHHCFGSGVVRLSGAGRGGIRSGSARPERLLPAGRVTDSSTGTVRCARCTTLRRSHRAPGGARRGRSGHTATASSKLLWKHLASRLARVLRRGARGGAGDAGGYALTLAGHLQRQCAWVPDCRSIRWMVSVRTRELPARAHASLTLSVILISRVAGRREACCLSGYLPHGYLGVVEGRQRRACSAA